MRQLARCRWLIQEMQESAQSGYCLALLLLLLRSDAQERVRADCAPRFLRMLARNIQTYRKLIIALEGCLLPRQFLRAVSELPELGQVEFRSEQIPDITCQLGVVAEAVANINLKLADKQNRISLRHLQDVVNGLILRAIEGSQKQPQIAS